VKRFPTPFRWHRLPRAEWLRTRVELIQRRHHDDSGQGQTPKAKKASLEERVGGTSVAHVNAPAVEGKANARLIEILAKHFGVRRSAVANRVWATSRLTLVGIDDAGK